MDKYKEPLTIEPIQALIEYIDEGDSDIRVIRAELGEMILRATGEYWK